ncbi:type II secretion system F family protein [Prauserella muralis]|uniref:Type II secretion system protein GspF domain-containing protein n=1 Tax=Prauserella muralis TaxID=588067 RepID=A0A2V4B7F8_9PSEU|nr:type II secretion system F family protein [Prauserella muralis]PXY31198.1 hypothetical protein BAY60_01965 [Prauserella muralis]TWE14502.1 tight adherence protein B [Prauserella muralis]
MLTTALACGGLALLCWPPAASAARLATVTGRLRGACWTVRLGRRHVGMLLAAAAALATAVLAGPAVALALTVLACAAGWYRRERCATRARLAAAEGLAEAVRAMAAELRTGAHPSAAADAAAGDADPGAAGVLRAVAASARLGGDLDAALAETAAAREPAVNRDVVARLVAGWALAREHGLPLAGVLDAVRRDVDATVRLAKQIDARMAGPRASAGILALLPLGGVALGEAMGAAPLRVLGTTAAGQVLLVAGCLLVLAGVAWSAALTGRVMAC